MVYDLRNGDPLWRITDDGWVDPANVDDTGPLYAHTLDAGWLSEAKAVAALAAAEVPT